MRTCLAVLTAAVVLAAPGVAPAQDDRVAADGDLRFFVFRTLDSGKDASPEQQRRCREHFGPARAPTVAVELDARLYGPQVDPASGRVTDDTYVETGPGFICGAPAVGGAPDEVEAYAYTGLPGAGEVELAGPCALRPVTAQTVAFLNCRLAVEPDAATGVLDGQATSNSIVNPGNVVPGAPTGSLWTGAVLRRPAPVPAGTTPPRGTQPNLVAESPAQFLVTVGTPAASAGPCRAGQAARAVALASVQPDLTTSLLAPGAPLTPLGSLQLCLDRAPGPGGRRAATATVRVPLNGRPAVLTARGDCAERPLRTDAAQALQSCGLLLDADRALGVRGGLLSSNGVVPAGAPDDVGAQHVWTAAVFTPAPEPTPAAGPRPVPGATPRLRLGALRRSARGLRVEVTCDGCRGTLRAEVVVQGRRALVARGRLTGRRAVPLRRTALGRRLLERGRARALLLRASATGRDGTRLRARRRAALPPRGGR